MHNFYTADQLSHIINQALLYQCACPAQVAKGIIDQRALYEYQQNCLNTTDTDMKVHQSIADCAETCHKNLEACLKEILTIEGWDPETLDMPESLKKRFMDNA